MLAPVQGKILALYSNDAVVDMPHLTFEHDNH